MMWARSDEAMHHLIRSHWSHVFVVSHFKVKPHASRSEGWGSQQFDSRFYRWSCRARFWSYLESSVYCTWSHWSEYRWSTRTRHQHRQSDTWWRWVSFTLCLARVWIHDSFRGIRLKATNTAFRLTTYWVMILYFLMGLLRRLLRTIRVSGLRWE